ncbi:MAG: ParB/RepB/Spo0J family partition protein [Oscillospiraceae bacterium]|nr:ParB/RepB/Spo0J family partition protein [Oscillospiraceae bacterium]
MAHEWMEGRKKLAVGLISPGDNSREITPESVRALADDIGKNGLLQPIVVNLIPDSSETAVGRDVLTVVAGHRRLKAVTLLGQKEIDAKVYVNLPPEQIALFRIAENLQRLQLSPMELSADLLKLMDTDVKKTQAQWAKQIGMDKDIFSNAVRLRHLPLEAQIYFQTSAQADKQEPKPALTIRHGRILLRAFIKENGEFKNPKQGKALIRIAKKAHEEQWTVSRLEEAIERFLSIKKPDETKLKWVAKSTANAATTLVKGKFESGEVKPFKNGYRITIDVSDDATLDSTLLKMGVEGEGLLAMVQKSDIDRGCLICDAVCRDEEMCEECNNYCCTEHLEEVDGRKLCEDCR